MDKIDDILDLFNRTLLEAEANNAEYNNFLEKCRIEDRKIAEENKVRLDEIKKDLEIIKANLETL